MTTAAGRQVGRRPVGAAGTRPEGLTRTGFFFGRRLLPSQTRDHNVIDAERDLRVHKEMALKYTVMVLDLT